VVEIKNNYLFFNKQKEFNRKLFRYFYERLHLFLCTGVYTKEIEIPELVFTSNKEKIKSYISSNDINFRALYDDTTNTILFNSDRYLYTSETFQFNKDELKDEIKSFRYIIPLSDIYHEQIHSIQYHYTEYLYDDFVEGTDELFTYIITGQMNIDYMKESISIWYLSRKILNMNLIDFYIFLRNSIVDYNFNKNYLLINKKIVKILGKEYNGNISIFYNNLKKDFGKIEYKDEMMKELNKLHNLIFYKY